MPQYKRVTVEIVVNTDGAGNTTLNDFAYHTVNAQFDHMYQDSDIRSIVISNIEDDPDFTEADVTNTETGN